MQLLENQTDKTEDHNVYLTKEIQTIHKKIFLSELEKCDAKLTGMSCLLGNLQTFNKESLYEQFQ